MNLQTMLSVTLWMMLVVSAHAAPLPPGVVGDGATDDTAAVQAALDAVAETGGELFLPAGQYRIDGSLTVPTGVTLRGSWQAPHHGVHQQGSALLITGGRGSENGAAITLEPSSAVRGFTMLWPEQTLDDVQPYPWAIAGAGMHNTVENLTFVNAWQGIRIGPEWNELHLIRNVFGCVLRRGVLIDGTTDIGRIENVHFNPHYWSRSGHPTGRGRDHNGRTARYMAEHLEAFVFGRTDWEYVLNTFVYAAKVGYRFIRTENGACNGQFIGIGADYCRTGLQIDQIQSIGIQVTNGEFTAFAGEPNAAIVTMPEADGAAQFVNCNFWATPGGAARLKGRTTVTFAECHFLDVPETGAIRADNGRLIVRGSNFPKYAAPAVVLNENVKAAIVTGNLQPGGLVIENAIGPRARIGLNEQPTVFPEGTLHRYRLNLGSPGDDMFAAAGWWGREACNDSPIEPGTCRWTKGKARLKLPVAAGSAYTLRIWLLEPGDLNATVQLVDGPAVATPKPGKNQLQLTIPASHTQDRNHVEIVIDSGTWTPSESLPDVTDSRELGVRVFGLEMIADDAAEGELTVLNDVANF